ncbi:hypothetical protein QBC32DRAFT_225993, partial [Pseudoneurospora amorphoporcata]
REFYGLPSIEFERDLLFYGLEDLPRMAIPNVDFNMIKTFESYERAYNIEKCPRCKQKWFEMYIVNNYCRTYYYKDDQRLPSNPHYFGANNELDFSDIPDFLPPLSQDYL